MLHHSKDIFGDDADVYRPERWIDSLPEQLREMKRYMVAVHAFHSFRSFRSLGASSPRKIHGFAVSHKPLLIGNPLTLLKSSGSWWWLLH